MVLTYNYNYRLTKFYVYKGLTGTYMLGTSFLFTPDGTVSLKQRYSIVIKLFTMGYPQWLRSSIVGTELWSPAFHPMTMTDPCKSPYKRIVSAIMSQRASSLNRTRLLSTSSIARPHQYSVH